MKVEHYLACVGEHSEQIDKLLRLQRFLRDEASRLKTGDPQLANHRLQQASALTHDILETHDKFDKQAERLRRFIERLPDPTEREILKLCYLSCLNTETAAGILGYSARQAYRIKQRALMHLEGMRY